MSALPAKAVTRDRERHVGLVPKRTSRFTLLDRGLNAKII
jgi:hypothetical protein